MCNLLYLSAISPSNHSLVLFLNPYYLKRSYGVNSAVESVDKIVICYDRIIKVFIIRNWSSLQGLFIDINWVTFSERKVSSLCLFYFAFRIFLVQYIILWSDIATLITPGWERLSCAFVKIWSIRVDVLQVILIRQLISC